MTGNVEVIITVTASPEVFKEHSLLDFADNDFPCYLGITPGVDTCVHQFSFFEGYEPPIDKVLTYHEKTKAKVFMTWFDHLDFTVGWLDSSEKDADGNIIVNSHMAVVDYWNDDFKNSLPFNVRFGTSVVETVEDFLKHTDNVEK